MTATTSTLMRELDHRSSNGIDVRLMWSESDGRVHVAVTRQQDRRGLHRGGPRGRERGQGLPAPLRVRRPPHPRDGRQRRRGLAASPPPPTERPPLGVGRVAWTSARPSTRSSGTSSTRCSSSPPAPATSAWAAWSASRRRRASIRRASRSASRTGTAPIATATTRTVLGVHCVPADAPDAGRAVRRRDRRRGRQVRALRVARRTRGRPDPRRVRELVRRARAAIASPPATTTCSCSSPWRRAPGSRTSSPSTAPSGSSPGTRPERRRECE